MHWNGQARNGPTPPAPRRQERITQRVLAEYVELARQARRLRMLRAELVELLLAGAPVEPGPLTAEVRREQARRLTIGKLSALIGADLVGTFMQEIGPSETRRLEVREVVGRPNAGPGNSVRRGPTSGFSF